MNSYTEYVVGETKHTTETAALEAARRLSQSNAYLSVVYSPHETGHYWYIDSEPPFVRSWETLVAEYRNGEEEIHERVSS